MTALVRSLDVADALTIAEFDLSDNTASRALCTSLGFREVAIWREIVSIEKRLERS